MEFDKKLKLHSGTRKAEIISRKWYRISFSVLLIGLVGMLAGAYLGIRTGIFWPCAVFLLLMLTSVPLVKIMCRCPCCGCAKHTKLLCLSLIHILNRKNMIWQLSLKRLCGSGFKVSKMKQAFGSRQLSPSSSMCWRRKIFTLTRSTTISPN